MGEDHPAALTIVAARDLFDFAARTAVVGERIDPLSPQTIRFLRCRLTGRDDETLHAIFLDGADGYIGSETIGVGDADQVELRFRPLIARLLEVGARGVILAHNHPSGDARPSLGDRSATARFAELAASLGIALLDHVIVARNEVFSMAQGKLV